MTSTPASSGARDGQTYRAHSVRPAQRRPLLSIDVACAPPSQGVRSDSSGVREKGVGRAAELVARLPRKDGRVFVVVQARVRVVVTQELGDVSLRSAWRGGRERQQEGLHDGRLTP